MLYEVITLAIFLGQPLQAGEDLFQGLGLGHDLGGGFGAYAGHAGDVVRGVADERLVSYNFV